MIWGQGPGFWAISRGQGPGPGARGQGPGARGQGSGARGRGAKILGDLDIDCANEMVSWKLCCRIGIEIEIKIEFEIEF